MDTDKSKRPHWNAYHLPLLNWIQTKATPTLERLIFAPAGLDTDKSKRPHWNAYHLPLLNWIQTKTNAHTGTPTICTRWIDTDNWNAYYLHLLDWIQTKATPTLERLLFAPAELDTDQSSTHTGTLNICTCWIGYRQLERLPFALLDWIQTTGTLTICPVGLDTDNWNAYYLPRWIDTDNWNAYYLHPLNWIQTKAAPTLERLPFALLDWIQTKATPTICPVGLDTHQSNAHTGTLTICTRWIDTDNWNAHHLPRWIGYTPKQTPRTSTTGTPTICPVGLDTHQSKRPHWNAYHLPCWIGYTPKQRPHWNAYYLHTLD